MSVPFTLIVPEQLTDATFVSSNVPEADYPVWTTGASYTVGQRVIVTTGHHKIYQCITAHSGVNHFPPDSPTIWAEVGPTNRWAMVDRSGGTVTSNPNSIVFTFTAGKVTAIGFLELNAASVQVVGTAGGSEFYNQTIILSDETNVRDWYEYFTLGIDTATEAIFLSIPYVSGSQFTVTISNPGGTAACGNMIFGDAFLIGQTQYGATAGIIDYSKKSVDEFGRAQLVKRNSSKRINANVWVTKDMTDKVFRKLNDARATACLWISAKDQYECLTVYGFYRDYSIGIEYPSYSILQIEIEGLT